MSNRSICVVCGQWSSHRTLAALPMGEIRDCDKCSVQSIHPQPTVEQLIAAYQNFNAGELARNEFVPYVEQAKAILLGDCTGSCLLPLRGRRFLDYGCGGGHFVKAAAELGMEAWGIDLDEEDAKFGHEHGLRIGIGDYRALDQLGPQSYTVILASHVLEHVPEPAVVIKALVAKLEPGGILIVRVPDQDSLPSHLKRTLRNVGGIKKGEWGYVQPPIHLHGYSIMTFRELARVNGLKLMRLAKVSPLDNKEFPTTERYWSRLGIHRQVYRLGRMVGSGGHLVAIMRRDAKDD